MEKRTYSIIEQDIDTEKFYEKIGVSKDFVDTCTGIMKAHHELKQGINTVELSKKLAGICTTDSELLMVGYLMGQLVTKIHYGNQLGRESSMLDLLMDALKSRLEKQPVDTNTK